MRIEEMQRVSRRLTCNRSVEPQEILTYLRITIFQQYSREGHLTGVNWFVLKATASVKWAHNPCTALRLENWYNIQSIKECTPVVIHLWILSPKIRAQIYAVQTKYGFKRFLKEPNNFTSIIPNRQVIQQAYWCYVKVISKQGDGLIHLIVATVWSLKNTTDSCLS